MVDFTHDDLLYSAGGGTPSFTKAVINKAANFACTLYKDYPWATTLGNNAFTRGLWDEMCRDRPPGLPDPPVPPSFQGGQCGGVLYNILVRFTGDDGTVNDVWSTGYYGAVSGASGAYIAAHYSNGERGWRCDVTSQGLVDAEPGYLPNGTTVRPVPPGNPVRFGRDVNVTAALVQVVRADNQPDTCGNLVPSYPHTPIPSGANQTNVQVSVGNNTYSVPIVVNPTVTNYTIKVQAGDIDLDFGLAGVTINNNAIFSEIQNTANNVTNIANNVGGIANNIVTVANAVTGLQGNVRVVNQVTAAALIATSVGAAPPSSPTNDTVQTDDAASAQAEEVDEVLVWVKLDLKNIPRNVKRQDGGDAQDVLYAGWFQFIIEGYYLPREPIHFVKSIFKAPAGAKGYAYTLYEGFTASVTEYRVRPPVDTQPPSEGDIASQLPLTTFNVINADPSRALLDYESATIPDS